MIIYLWCLKIWAHAMCPIGCRGMFDTISSWNIPIVVTSGILAAHPKCPAALGACLAHAWDTMILSQSIPNWKLKKHLRWKKYQDMKLKTEETWWNMIMSGNVNIW